MIRPATHARRPRVVLFTYTLNEVTTNTIIMSGSGAKQKDKRPSMDSPRLTSAYFRTISKSLADKNSEYRTPRRVGER